MILHQGDYWDCYDKADLFLFTGNGTLRSDGSLVMGAGSALQVKKKFPGIDQTIGNYLRDYHQPVYGKEWRRDYYFIISPDWPENSQSKIGVFQTKGYWKQPSNIGMIRKSAAALQRFIQQPRNRDLQVYCPFPGIGNGGLEPEEVLPHLLNLPNNIIFCIYDEKTFNNTLQLLQQSLTL